MGSEWSQHHDKSLDYKCNKRGTQRWIIPGESQWHANGHVSGNDCATPLVLLVLDRTFPSFLRKNLMLCEDDDCVRLPAALPHALPSSASGEVDGLIIRRTFSPLPHESHPTWTRSCAWNSALPLHGGGNVRGARFEDPGEE